MNDDNGVFEKGSVWDGVDRSIEKSRRQGQAVAMPVFIGLCILAGIAKLFGAF